MYQGDSPTQSGVASETQDEATDSKAASAPALCHTSRLLENRNTSRILPPWTDDLVMPGVWNGEPRQSTEVHCSGLSASRRTSVGLGQSQGYEERQPHAHVGVFGQVDDGRVPIVPTRITLGEVIATSCSRAVSLGGRGNGGGGSPARKPAQRATFGDFLSAECERLRGGDSLSSEAMAVEDSGPAKAEEQDRLKALDASIANLEKARGGKPDVAIDEVLRQKRLERQELKDQMQSRKSTKALLKAAIAAREKAVIKLEGLQKEEMDLTQLLLLKQQEISDAKSEAAEKAREVETLQARRLAEVDCEGSVSHVSSSATCSAVGAWTCGVAPRGRSSQVRGVVQQRRDRGQGVSGSIFGGSEPGVSSYVASSGSCSSTPVAATSTGSAFRAAKAPFPSQRATPYAAGFQVSKSQERPPGADQFVNAVAQPLPDADV